MKASPILFTFLTLLSCNESEKHDESGNKTAMQYQEIGEKSFSFGSENAILDCTQMSDDSYRLYIRTNADSASGRNNYYFFTINSKGDSLGIFPVAFDHFLTDNVELENCYFTVTTDRRTMGAYTKDFLNKYDKNWKLIWTKKMNNAKYPSGSTLLTLGFTNELLLISDEFIPETTKKGISIRRYGLNGKRISEQLICTKNYANPVSIMKSADSHFFLTAEQYDPKTNCNSLYLLKLNQKGNTIWTRKHSNFYPKQTILAKNGDLVFYGSEYSLKKEGGQYLQFLKIIILDKEGNLKSQKEIRQNYYEKPGNVIETKTGNYFFSSTITPKKNDRDSAYLFELSPKGDLIFERKMNYSLGTNSVPFLIGTEGQITVIGQKWIGKSGQAFRDVIQVTKLKTGDG